MTRWIIHPGQDAFLWEPCKEYGCITIGWDDSRSYNQYKSLKDVKRRHTLNDANSIWYFYKKIQPDDLIIATQGRNTVLGIGKVTSEYLAPRNRKNPAYKNNRLEYKHVRLVDWLITRKIDGLSYGLPLKTVTPDNKGRRWKEIERRYLEQNLGYKKIFDDLNRLTNKNKILLKLRNKKILLLNEYEETEGDRLKKEITFRKRNKVFIDKIKKSSDYTCTVCAMSFEKRYGKLGKDYIIAHHIKPLKKGKRKPHAKDIALVCANCHAMLHRTEPPMGPKELQELLRE